MLELNKTYQGDCLEIMKQLDDKSIDMTFTSPPFKEEDIQGDYWSTYSLWFNEIKRVTSKVAIIIHSATKINYLFEHYPPSRLLIWGKGFSCYSWRFNPIFAYQLAEDYNINKRLWSDLFNISSIGPKWDKKFHKYQDPVKLYKTIISMFPECQIVLDPFIGSGTTAEACLGLKINYIGIEINPDYVDIANKRLANTYRQLELIK